MCAAGGSNSYMSVMAFANSLMLDFRCWITPRFVYATPDSFSENSITDQKINERIEKLVSETIAGN